MENKEWQREQERLDRVREKMKARMAELEPQVAGLQDQASEMKKRFWDEVTVNTNTDEEYIETFYTIRQQAVLLSERERTHQVLTREWQGLNRLYPSPYFGRVDFAEEGQGNIESVYVGVSAFVDDDGLTFLVYDWRSPIAGLYYDYPPGPAGYDTPVGRIDGELTHKRQYQIREGELVSLFDAGVTIGDELLQRMLAKGADAQMRSIVATIQREQNAIIRDEQSRLLVVQGAAGSGKTSAALQRVAYLLYRHRETLRADQIVLFSPNPIFNSYVSTVLPELGEDNMQQTTWQEYLDYWLRDTLVPEHPFDQMEYGLTAHAEPGYAARQQGMAFKSSEAYMHDLQRYAAWLGAEGLAFVPIALHGRELITAEQMQTQLDRYDTGMRLSYRLDHLRQWLLEELTRLERRARGSSWVRKEMDALDPEVYAEAFGELHKDKEAFDLAERYAAVREQQGGPRRGDEADFDFAEREEAWLSRRIAKEHFKPLRKAVRELAFVDVPAMYARLFEDEAGYIRRTGAAALPQLWAEVCRQTAAQLARKALFYEDATPYLYFKELIEGVRTNSEVRHVFVDEGQDYSPFQYAYMHKLFPRARMTVLGDFGQAIFTQTTRLDATDSPLARLFGAEDTRVIRLERSYRSTREIVAFTKALQPEAAGVVPFDRSGPQPQLIRLADASARAARILADIAALQREGHPSIAVITKTAAESREAYEVLRSQDGLRPRLIAKDSSELGEGLVVLPVYLAKGIEFDAVLIYDASADTFRPADDPKLLYTACTRAMHRLLLYATGEWTPAVAAMAQT
ncbi:ATP-binding domain-containing protein [Paenibacillus sp. IB182496]|uniref:ATP-binding domain-containing protein n=2 Tax=Paenibacillus sabuli TaxID=2772509 RepID=A0A927BRI1_9BACL|nr:ATP-binding domain-containing protein [Paenibacillus sabuli]